MFSAIRSRFGRLAVVVAMTINVACDDDTPVTRPTPPVTTVTDSFSGSINKNGAASHSFVVVAAGSTVATLTTLTPLTDSNPDDSVPFNVGFGVGTWDGTVCTVVAARDKAPATTVIYGNVNSAGTLCVRVYDIGEIVDSVDYEISVVHP